MNRFNRLYLALLLVSSASTYAQNSFITVRKYDANLDLIKNQIFIVVRPSNMSNAVQVPALREALESQLKSKFEQYKLNVNIAFQYVYPKGYSLSGSMIECAQSKVGHCLFLRVSEYENKTPPVMPYASIDSEWSQPKAMNTEAASGRYLSSPDNSYDTGNLRWRVTLFNAVETSTDPQKANRKVLPVWSAVSGLTNFTNESLSKDKYVGASANLASDLIVHMQDAGLLPKK